MFWYQTVDGRRHAGLRWCGAARAGVAIDEIARPSDGDPVWLEARLKGGCPTGWPADETCSSGTSVRRTDSLQALRHGHYRQRRCSSARRVKCFRRRWCGIRQSAAIPAKRWAKYATSIVSYEAGRKPTSRPS